MTYRFKGLLTRSDQGPSAFCAAVQEENGREEELEVLVLRPMDAEEKDCCWVVRLIGHPLRRSLPVIRVHVIATAERCSVLVKGGIERLNTGAGRVESVRKVQQGRDEERVVCLLIFCRLDKPSRPPRVEGKGQSSRSLDLDATLAQEEGRIHSFCSLSPRSTRDNDMVQKKPLKRVDRRQPEPVALPPSLGKGQRVCLPHLAGGRTLLTRILYCRSRFGQAGIACSTAHSHCFNFITCPQNKGE